MLAKEIGVSRTTVENWEKDKHLPTKKRVPLLMKALDLPLHAFNPYSGGVIAADPRKTKLVALIEWSDLHLLAAGTSMLAARKATPVQADPGHSPRAVALRVQDSSMEPTFRVDELIIIDPAVSPQANDAVAVRLASGEHALRLYVPRRNGAFDLVAENPDYATITVNNRTPVEIVGVVVEHHRKLRR